MILARHGNTFGPGDAVVWVGARSDLPLVEKGHAQAEAIADGLIAADLAPSRIWAGPLKRTAETAAIVAARCGLAADAVTHAEELREIDYGTWEGRSNDEIRAEVGDDPIDGWQKRSVWPDGFGWRPSEAEILADWDRLVARIAADAPPDATVLIVSSNGIFRLVARALGLAPSEAKMNTGALARLELDGGDLRVLAWNLDPARLAP
ncbi:MAG: histidine phosphatase family protein [Hyphomicrobiales bacterium]|nr:histidine phosphatase family protein [Hyphomicrobiales bacterium]